MTDIGGSDGVGSQLTDYAKQVAGLNSQIDALSKGGLLPESGPDRQTFENLKRQRDSLVTKATGLQDKAKSTGLSIDFTGEVKKASQAMKAPKVKNVAAETPPKAAALSPQQTETITPALKEEKKGPLTLADFRKKYPQYDSMPDDKLTEALYNKYYADTMSRQDFNDKIEYKPKLPEGVTPAKIGAVTEPQARAAAGRLEAVTGPPSGAGTMPEMFQKKQLLEKQLIAAGKNPEDDPEYRQLAKNLARAVSAGDTQTALLTAGMDLLPGGEAVAKGVGAAARGAKGVVQRALGKESKEAVGGLRTEAAKRAAATATEEEQAAAKATARAGEIEKTQAELRARAPKVAAQRAEAAVSPTPPGQARGFGLRPAVKTPQGIKVGRVGDNHETIVPGAPEAQRGFVDEQGRFLSREQAAAKAKQAGAQVPDSLHSEDLNRVSGLPERAEAPFRPAPGVGAEKEAVVAKVAQQTRELEETYREAGLSTEEAKARAAEQATKVQDAEIAVDKLEKDLLAKPGTSAEEFGAELRKTTQELHDKYADARAREAGFDKALTSAGDELRVNTAPAQQQIEASLKDIRNPSLQRVLEGLKGLLMTVREGAEGEVAHDKLSVRAADSLRKYLDGVIQSKMFGDQAVDRETLFVIKQIKRQLVQSATEAWQPYRDALARWRTLSRPLDIVERKGALRKVIDTDPVSTDYALTQAQVVGRVIEQARAGNPTFTRLITENPQLRDSARLYFTQDLFGKGVVPTEAAMRTWLRANEAPLRQLGLFDEFRNIRVARETAQKAVDAAKDTAKETMAQAKIAEREEREIAKQLAKAAKVRSLATKRAEEARAGRPTAEKLKEEAAKRAEKGAERLGTRKEEALTKAGKHETSANTYRRFETELNSAVDKAVVPKTREFIGKMRRDGRIDDKTYGEMLEMVNKAEETIADTKKLRVRLGAIALIAALSTGGYEAWRNLRILLGAG